MKLTSTQLYFSVLIICSFLIGDILYSSYHRDNIFSIILYVVIGIVWLICFFNIIKKERRQLAEKFRITKYIFSSLSILTLVPIVMIYSYYQTKLDVPTLLKAERHGVYAYFKTDGTYFIRSGEWGSKTHFYGNYVLLDSIIQIDTDSLDDVLTSNRFLIKTAKFAEEKHRPDYDRVDTKQYLVQIDNQGKEILKRSVGDEVLPYKFEVVIDNRK